MNRNCTTGKNREANCGPAGQPERYDRVRSPGQSRRTFRPGYSGNTSVAPHLARTNAKKQTMKPDQATQTSLRFPLPGRGRAEGERPVPPPIHVSNQSSSHCEAQSEALHNALRPLYRKGFLEVHLAPIVKSPPLLATYENQTQAKRARKPGRHLLPPAPFRSINHPPTTTLAAAGPPLHINPSLHHSTTPALQFRPWAPMGGRKTEFCPQNTSKSLKSSHAAAPTKTRLCTRKGSPGEIFKMSPKVAIMPPPSTTSLPPCAGSRSGRDAWNKIPTCRDSVPLVGPDHQPSTRRRRQWAVKTIQNSEKR